MSGSAPIADMMMRGSGTTRGANSDLMHRSKQPPYSITSSARKRIEVCTVRPIAFVVLRFRTTNAAGDTATATNASQERGMSPAQIGRSPLMEPKIAGARLGFGFAADIV
jgi:hypothetical protein